MSYLLDSDIVIDHLENVPGTSMLLDQLTADGIAISIITYLEAFEGTTRRGPSIAAAETGIRDFVAGIPVLPISFAIAERCARLRERLRRQSKSVRARALDLIIAATALEHRLTLVTRNAADYKDVPGLDIHSVI